MSTFTLNIPLWSPNMFRGSYSCRPRWSEAGHERADNLYKRIWRGLIIFHLQDYWRQLRGKKGSQSRSGIQCFNNANSPVWEVRCCSCSCGRLQSQLLLSVVSGRRSKWSWRRRSWKCNVTARWGKGRGVSISVKVALLAGLGFTLIACLISAARRTDFFHQSVFEVVSPCFSLWNPDEHNY